MNLNDVLTPALIFVGLGIFAGLLLSICSKVFAVKVDEKIEKIKEILPGANCGACGFSGCEDYATKLCEQSGVKTSLCLPGGNEVSLKISEILGTEFEESEAVISEVNCNGTLDVTKQTFEYTGIKSCTACNMFYGGNSSCTYGCLGFGDCAKVCEYDAIEIINGVAKIIKDKCVGCGMCKDACPKGIISMRKKSQKVIVKCSNCDMGKNTRNACTVGCIGCKKCEKTCKYGAISVNNNNATIDYDKCTNCEECIAVCPVKCIVSC